MNYSNLVADIQTYTEDDGAKFKAALPLIIKNAMTMMTRALPLQMYETGYVFSLRPNSDRIMFKDLDQVLDIVTVDGLTLGSGEPVERRSPAYIQMYRGKGSPSYFCDIEGGLRIAPTPFRSEVVTLNYMRRPDISAENPTNWYTDNVYDILFKACLVEAHSFLIEPDMVQSYQGEMGSLIAMAAREHQDMLRVNIYQPIAAAAEPATKG